MPTQRHCLSVFDNPDRKVIVSFNKTLVGRDFSSYLGCWEVNDTYQCGEILFSGDKMSQQKLLTIVLPVCLTIGVVFIGSLIYVFVRNYRLKNKVLEIRQQQRMAILNLDFTKAMQLKDLELGLV